MLDVFAVPVVVVGDTQGLLLACLPEVLAELRPVQPVGLDLAVAAGQELEGAAPQAYLGLLQEPVAPAAEVAELGEDEAGFPREQARRSGEGKGEADGPRLEVHGAEPGLRLGVVRLPLCRRHVAWGRSANICQANERTNGWMR